MTAQDDRGAAEEIARRYHDTFYPAELSDAIFAALQKAREEERVLSPKAIRFVIPALLNEAARHEHLAEVAVDEDAVADHGMDAAYLRSIAAGLNQRFPSSPTRTEKP